MSTFSEPVARSQLVGGTSPRRPAPLPARLSPNPSLGTSPSVKDLLSDRSRHSPLPLPSPALSTTSAFSAFDSPHSSTFHFPAHHEHHDMMDPLPQFDTSPQLPPTPQSFNSEFSLSLSPSPSMTMVRTAQIARVPASTTGAGRGSIDTLESNEEVIDPLDHESETTVFDGRWHSVTTARPELWTLGGDDVVLHSRQQPLSTSPAPEIPKKTMAVANDSQVDTHQRSESVDSRGSASSWKAGLDRAVVKIAGAGADPTLRPEVDAMARMKSILGPKMKIISPAPWDTDETPSGNSKAASDAASTRARRSSEAGSRRPPLPSPSSSSTSLRSSAKENTKPHKAASRSRSFSVLSSARRSTADRADDERASEEALRGLGLRFGLGVSITSPTKPKREPPPAPGFSFPRSGSTTLVDQASRPPAGFELISTNEPMPQSGSNGSLGVRIQPSISSLSMQSMGAGGSTSPTTPGSGYKLISLEEARTRETERVAATAAHRKAMLPVEHIAVREDVSPSAQKPREREASSGAASIVVSSGVSAGSGATTAPRTLKSKKSGFLKRMMGHEKVAPPPVPALADLPTVRSFRSLPDDYVHAASSLSVSNSTASLQAPAGSSRVAFGSTPMPDPEQRLRKSGLAPSLSLRPISMAFSAGLPTDFLAQNSYPFHADVEDTHTSSFVRPALKMSDTTSSMTMVGAPSIFDATCSNPSTPASPFPPEPSTSSNSTVASASTGAEAFAALQEQFAKAKRTWILRQLDLEAQIRILRMELDELRADGEESGHTCDHCGCSTSPRPHHESASVLTRPRPVPSTSSGSSYKSGAALAI